MTEAAGTAFSVVHDMNIVKVAITVTEVGVDSRIRILEQVLVVTFEAEAVNAFLVGCIQCRGVGTDQEPEHTRRVWVVTAGTLAASDGAVKVFLPFQFFLDVPQGRIPQFIGVVTTEAEIDFIGGEQAARLGEVGGVAVAASAFPDHRLMRVSDLREFVLKRLVTLKAECR